MPKKQTTFSPDVLIELQRGSGQVLHMQLTNALRTAIHAGTLCAGNCLPSSRVLARDLGMSRSVVVEAYEQLNAEGYLVSDPRSGTRVAATVVQDASPRSTKNTQEILLYDFRPGVPDAALFPRSAWGTAMRQILRTVPTAEFGYGDVRGAQCARQELAAYLQRVRGVIVRPEQLILCTGFAQGLSLLCQILRTQGLRHLAVEDPTHPDQRALIAHYGLEPVGIPVDEEGLRVDMLAKAEVRAVLMTPAHQFPTGVVLSPARRRALLSWAQTQNGVIIEDDYDAEYRYDRAPVGALQGLDPEHVVYAGSVSKTLSPALRIGWLVVPPRLLDAVIVSKRYADLGSSVLDQLAFAHMLAAGNVDRHLRQARQIYRARRDTLVQAITEHIPKVDVWGLQPVSISL